MDKLWRGAFANPIMKHHRTGSHGEHIVPTSVREDMGGMEEEYDEDMENDRPYSDLKRLGDGETPYLFKVMIAGGGSMTYDYIVSLDNTTQSEYQEALELYQIPSSERPSSGYYPDIYEGVAQVTADQLGVSRDSLGPENEPPFSTVIVAESVQEVYAD